MKVLKYLLFFPLVTSLFLSARSQSSDKLFFREDWKEIPAALPVTPQHVSNPDLALSLYGPAANEIKKSNHPEIANDPFYIWSGACGANWALTLQHRSQAVDLSLGKIRLRSRQTGFRQLRIIVRTGAGDWLVSDQHVSATRDWTEVEFAMADMRWRKLEIERITEREWVESPDLTHVLEIGFTDLMAGGGTPASSRVDWIEVYGRPLKRQSGESDSR